MSELHQCVAAGDLAGVRRCLHNDPQAVHRYDQQGLTPLMVAVSASAADFDMLECLREHGADLNALKEPQAALDLATIDPEVMEVLRSEADESLLALLDESSETPREDGAPESLLQFAVAVAPLEKIRWLLAAGASPGYIDGHGYGVFLRAFFRDVEESDADFHALLQCLLDAGAPPDVVSAYGESPLHVASGRGNFDLVQTLLAWGLDPQPLGWDSLCRAIVSGDLSGVKLALQHSSLDIRDGWERTPFLLSVHAGQQEIAAYLLEQGSALHAQGRGETNAIGYAIEGQQGEMLAWLLPHFDLARPCAHGQSPLRLAVQCDASSCVRVLLAAGADVCEESELDGPVIRDASSVAMVRMLQAAGADLRHMPNELRSELVGTPIVSPPSLASYQKHKSRVFGDQNPQRQSNAFWTWMVSTRMSAYAAATHFGEEGCDREAVWCFDRFGHSVTDLSGGGFVEIGGEHEDFYDPDFCIYNDVVVHDGAGQSMLFGYPRTVFPPTDFHSATRVHESIYIIGNLGYPDDRRPGHTPVFRLSCQDWSIAEVATHGDVPGWLHGHLAMHVGTSVIRVWGGKLDTGNDLVDNTQCFELDVDSARWRCLGPTAAGSAGTA